MKLYENFYKKYYNDELFVLGALDCFGVPHTPDNIVLKSYIDMVCDELKDNKINLKYVNMHSIAFNKTWHLEKILDVDYTKKEYYDLNLTQTKKVLANGEIFPYPINSKFINEYYINPTDPKLKITSYFSDSKNPIFMYSCGQMNFHKYVNMPTNDLRQIIPEITVSFQKNLYKTLNDVKHMVDYILKINPSATIYMFGVYPMFENRIVRKILTPFYNYANKNISNFFQNYNNIYFVDVISLEKYVAPNDCHPNYMGQCYMKEKVLEIIKTY